MRPCPLRNGCDFASPFAMLGDRGVAIQQRRHACICIVSGDAMDGFDVVKHPRQATASRSAGRDL